METYNMDKDKKHYAKTICKHTVYGFISLKVKQVNATTIHRTNEHA